MIRIKYPEAYESDKQLKLSPEKRFGKFSVAHSERDNLYIYNLYGQYKYGSLKPFIKTVHTNYDKLTETLRLMCGDIIERNASNSIRPLVGIPYGMGCNLAGGNWDYVTDIVNNISNSMNVDFGAFKLKL